MVTILCWKYWNRYCIYFLLFSYTSQHSTVATRSVKGVCGQCFQNTETSPNYVTDWCSDSAYKYVNNFNVCEFLTTGCHYWYEQFAVFLSTIVMSLSLNANQISLEMNCCIHALGGGHECSNYR